MSPSGMPTELLTGSLFCSTHSYRELLGAAAMLSRQVHFRTFLPIPGSYISFHHFLLQCSPALGQLIELTH